ncbi:UTP--glucose-1-phosphate uridylyltransferase 3, chloroplastic isoform X1 [Vitis vinifera]|uniref:UTP--glucose-1-phosphate uridylyltransferase 3, chloroplastic isoform X1 n=1 Tax=Vitis vinifera TaxID=29760 RepID=UPI0005402568|nr:UTP--glucose-1-phosphate uridylyltransferase 3, chloroplastic isoform X1 [Vitis vinifera]|eukprot:XP_010658245.1 PREDICTED: UTP--glucose-1-phosphate uridylyltransferase 3, chloroplastic isoform X1 [Vitis vinifera]
MARTTETSIFRYHGHQRLFSFNPTSSVSLSFSRPLFSLSLSSVSSSSAALCCRPPRVSTAPVEYESQEGEFDFEGEIARLQSLRSAIGNAKSVEEKLAVVDGDSRVKRFFCSGKSGVSRVLGSVSCDSYELFLVKCLVAAGQEHVLSSGLGLLEGEFESERSALRSVFYGLVEMIEKWEVSGAEGLGKKNGVADEEIGALKKLLKTLREIEQFYDCIGGIIGYQIVVLELLTQSLSKKHINWIQHINEAMQCQLLELHSPCGLDLSKNTAYASQAALWGVEGLPELGEIYPLGGSADRLGLVDPDTGECLPAAMLPYCGRTLLEGLIRDLQAREFLYFKIYGKQCITPVAIMTSAAKNNHEHITSLCERHQWFGRGQSSFQLFEQPLVPAVSAEDGEWLVTKPFTPVCKPGGHGVIWKLAYDKGIFQWFYDHGRKGATVRQVSNVVAATDLTLLALAGIGLRHRKKMGFASCKRNSGATEGINVLIEKNLDGKWEYGLSCIEYTEFDKFGITDGLLSSNSLQAGFPANTNILYVDLPSAELVGSSNDEKSLPGMVLNIKKPIVYEDYFGFQHSVSGGRLECTMQNIADNFFNTYASRCYKGVEADVLDTFIVYNERRRVTSSAKKKRKHADKSLHQTPDGSLLDIMRNAYDLLSQCDIKMPEQCSGVLLHHNLQIEGNDRYADSGPPFLVLLHPALGPLWEVSRQKFYGGSISMGSELQLEIAEFLWRNVQLDGSMIVIAENVMGSTRIDENGEPMLQYGHRCGRCKLQNVKVQNKGINWNSGDNIYWKHDVQRFEALKIILHGNAEFEATDVILQRNHVFEVPNGYKMKISSKNPGLAVDLNPIEEKMMDSGSWFWNYKISGTHIHLELVEF